MLENNGIEGTENPSESQGSIYFMTARSIPENEF